MRNATHQTATGLRSTLAPAVPALLLITIFLLVPALLGLLSTFTSISPTDTDWHVLGFGNYSSALGNKAFRTSVGNVLILTMLAVPTETLMGLAIAGTLRRPFAGRGLVRAVLLGPWLVSPIGAGAAQAPLALCYHEGPSCEFPPNWRMQRDWMAHGERLSCFAFERDLEWPAAAAALISTLARALLLVIGAERALESLTLISTDLRSWEER